MESVLVNARVPRAKKEVSVGILESLGATTSELINSAYDYLLEHKELPTSRNTSKEKRLHDREAFAAFAEESTLDINWGEHPESFDYKQFMSSRKRADYESLA